MKVTKAIITCGGYATRFLPITKAIPKEMLPVGNKPVIHYIVDELVEAGITDILILIGRGREALQNYFDAFPELDEYLKKKGIKIETNFNNVNIYSRRVPLPRGAADNILHAKSFVGKDPFIVAYSDDIFFNENPTKAMIELFARNKYSYLTCVPVACKDTHNYGIINTNIKATDCTCLEEGTCSDARRVMQVNYLVEKPKSNPPSNLAVTGRFLLKPEIFELIEEDMRMQYQEVCMVAQLNKLAKRGKLVAVRSTAFRFDTGEPKGLLAANNFVSQLLLTPHKG